MDRSIRVCEIIETLHEEIDGTPPVLTEFQVGVVLRRAAEIALAEVLEERTALLAYLDHYATPSCPGLVGVLDACQLGLHRLDRTEIPLE